MLPKNWMNFAKKHKLITAAGAIVALVLVVSVVVPIILGGFQSLMRVGDRGTTYNDYVAPGGDGEVIGDYGAEKSYRSAPSALMSTPAPESGPYVDVKTSSLTIETIDADGDSSQIRALTESLDGYVETTNKYDGETAVNVYLTSRVPSDRFQEFVDSLNAQYEPKDFSVSFYRLSIQRETNELDIIATSLANYAELRNRTMQIPLDEKQINLLFTLTQKELDLKSLEKQYTSSLTGKQELADYSTVTITLTQKKEVKIMPEDLGERLRLKVKQALDDISNSVMDLLTGSLAVFVFAIKSVVYIILFVVPLVAGYRLLRKLYAWITTKV